MKNSDHITLSLKLAGEEDLLLGKGSQNQTRFSGIRKISKITLIKPVDNINELKALDTDRYMYALCVGLYDTPDSRNGYFYYFDPYSEEEEDIPYIVAPSLGIGRWKYIPYALDLIKKSLDKYVGEEVPIIVNEEVLRIVNEITPTIVQHKAEEVVETKLPPLVQTKLPSVVETKLPPLVETKLPPLVQTKLPPLVQTKLPSVVEIKLPSVVETKLPPLVETKLPPLVETKLPPLVETKLPPLVDKKLQRELSGLVDIKLPALVGKELRQLQNQAYSVTKTISRDLEGSALTFRLKQGRLTFKLYKGDTLKCSFDADIVVDTWSSNYLRISNVFYLKNNYEGVESNRFGYITYPKFCCYFRYNYEAVQAGAGVEGENYWYRSPLCMYFESGASSEYDKIVIESKAVLNDLDVKVITNPELDKEEYDHIIYKETFKETKFFAVREGGGTDIEGIGCIFPSLRNESDYNYYLFRNGFIPWTRGLQLPWYYSSYNTDMYADLNVDPSDRYIVNVGNRQGTQEGVLKNSQLPNITGTFSSSTHTNVDRNPTGAFRQRTTNGYGYKQGDQRVVTGNYTFKASNSNSIYQDGINSVETDRIVTRYYVRVY